ncbi:MAG: hypothetical protein QNJ85_08170 [Gammaproteobacteria bacterium]|nr:hypothetical protein [Gammaproteobacteria bacterium]
MRRLACTCLLPFASLAQAGFSGNVAVETQTYTESAQFDGQFDDNVTFSFEPRWNGEWNDGNDLWSVELFLRADNKDAGREHADLRELLWLRIDGDNEWRVGVNTMFWGVTESQHLVDVINQVDLVEGIDREEKLGQPMLHWKRYQDWGVLDLLVLPGFRERTFQEAEGRLRPPLVVDTDQAEYESSDEDAHVDFALRFSQTYGDLDLGLSLFDGTSRDPLLLPGTDAGGKAVLIPFYEQMTQFGLDAQLIYQDWIYKLEYIHRNARSNDFNAAVGGFEYTLYGVYESDLDLGLLLEYSHDDRPENDRGAFDRDVFVATRFTFNDQQSSEILAGLIVDVDKGSRSFRVEGSRRFGASWKAILELQTFSNIDGDDVLAAFEHDDFLLLELAYYF